MKHLLLAITISMAFAVDVHAEEITKYRGVVRIVGIGAKGNYWESKELYATEKEAKKAAGSYLFDLMRAMDLSKSQYRYVAGSEPVKGGK